MTVLLCYAAALPLLALAAFTDLAVRIVPNRVSLVLALDGIAAHCFDHSLPNAMTAAMVVGAFAALAWRHGLMGGGDVKLLAAVALIVPTSAVVPLIVLIALAGGILASIYWVFGRISRRAPTRIRTSRLRRILSIEHRRIIRGFSIPYAVAISVGTAFILTKVAST